MTDYDREGALSASLVDPERPPLGLNVEAILEGFPGFAVVLEQIDQVPAAKYLPEDADVGQCDRCGASIPRYGRGGGLEHPRRQHTEWHRQLTIAIHLNAWLSNVVGQAVGSLASAGAAAPDAGVRIVDAAELNQHDQVHDHTVALDATYTDASRSGDTYHVHRADLFREHHASAAPLWGPLPRLATAREWNAELEAGIMDWDGFRDQPEDRLYDEGEFRQRLFLCTLARPGRID